MNLIRRGRVYHFRQVIPQDLRGHFGGKKEFVRSLHTTDYKEARLLLRQAQGNTERLHFYLRTGMVDKARLKRIIEEYHRRCYTESKDEPVNRFMFNTNPMPGIIYDDLQQDIHETEQGARFLTGKEQSELEQYKAIADGIRKDMQGDLQYTIDRARGLLRSNKMEIDEDSKEFIEFCFDVANAELVEFERLAKGGGIEYERYMDALVKKTENRITLAQAVENYIKTMAVNKRKESSIKSTRYAFNIIVGYSEVWKSGL